MSDSINKFLDAIDSNELLEAKDRLHTALAEKVSAKMEARKIELAKEKLEKDADDPCWDGYVQLGTKKKNGKEVPNCVPMESVNEAAAKIACLECDEVSTAAAWKKNRNFCPKCKTSNQGVAESKSVNESTRIEVPIRDARKASEIAADMFYGEYKKVRNNAFVFKDSDIAAAFEAELAYEDIETLDESVNESKSKVEIKRSSTDNKNVSKRDVTYDVYVNGKFDKHFKDIIDAEEYAKKKDPNFKLNEQSDKMVEVSVRDARKANEIAKDMFRGEYSMDGSNVFVFKKSGAASDFRAELSKQGVEV